MQALDTGKCMMGWGMAGQNQMLRLENPRIRPSIRPASWGHVFQECDSHLITYKSGNIAMQIDFILFCRTMRKLVTNVKVIPGEKVALQHQLLV